MFWAFHTHQWRTFWAMLMSYLVPPFVVLAIAVAVYLVDKRWEVIAETSVEAIAVNTDGTVQIAGRMNKVRECSFTGIVSQRSDGAVAPVRYNKPRFTRPMGWQHFGPLVIEARPGDEVTVIAQHQCHAFWPHTEVLTAFTVPK